VLPLALKVLNESSFKCCLKNFQGESNFECLFKSPQTLEQLKTAQKSFKTRTKRILQVFFSSFIPQKTHLNWKPFAALPTRIPQPNFFKTFPSLKTLFLSKQKAFSISSNFFN
jgi:hypothetical protein